MNLQIFTDPICLKELELDTETIPRNLSFPSNDEFCKRLSYLNYSTKENIDFKYNLKVYFSILSKYKPIFFGLTLILFLTEFTYVVDRYLFKVVIDYATQFSTKVIVYDVLTNAILIIVAVFFGVSNSAPEIIKDRLILKREKLINVSILGYFICKFIVLLIFAFIQSALFILLAHIILEEYNLILYHIIIKNINGGSCRTILTMTMVVI